MRHRKKGRKLGRTSSHRKSLFRNQVTALFEHEQICTTLQKCKELRGIAEKLITLAKRGDLHARRQAAKMVYGKRLHDKKRPLRPDVNGQEILASMKYYRNFLMSLDLAIKIGVVGIRV